MLMLDDMWVEDPTFRKNTDPSRKFVGLMVKTSHPHNTIVGLVPFLGHTWILRDQKNQQKQGPISSVEVTPYMVV